MLCYRLVHYTDELPEIKTSVRNRDEELSTPLLQFFYGTDAFVEIKEAVEFFLSQRKQRRSRSLAAALYPILKGLINTKTESNIVNIPFSTIWERITIDHAIKGNLFSDNQYETKEYGPLYNNTLSKFISDNLNAELKHGEDGSVLTFDKVKFSSYDELYSQTASPDVKLVVELVNPIPEGTEGNDGPGDGYGDFESIGKKDNASQEPSELSEPSAFNFPPKCYRCDFTNYNTKGEYDYHCVTRHQGLPAYPGPADIRESNLIPQGMSWESI
jgi:hypothetical protein